MFLLFLDMDVIIPVDFVIPVVAVVDVLVCRLFRSVRHVTSLRDAQAPTQNVPSQTISNQASFSASEVRRGRCFLVVVVFVVVLPSQTNLFLCLRVEVSLLL